MPSAQVKDTLGKIVNVAHRSVYRASGGKVGGKGLGMPVVELQHVGRKSGKRRNTMLTTPLVEGDAVMLVASWGGDDRHPQWYLNLVENPEVELTIHGQTKPMKARVADAAERADLWPKITSVHGNYAGYQKRTDREIPVVILEPR